MARLRFLVTVFAYTNIFVAVLILVMFVWAKITRPAPMILPDMAGIQDYSIPVPLPPDPPPNHMVVEGLRIITPVVGKFKIRIADSFEGARSGNRVHKAIDIMAPHNSRLLAVSDGYIAKMHNSSLGGICLYLVDSSNRFVFYYAHLDRYEAGIKEGMKVRQGQLLGYVGDTGNAKPGEYHLHFAIWFKTDPNNFRDGIKINPYHVLYKDTKLEK